MHVPQAVPPAVVLVVVLAVGVLGVDMTSVVGVYMYLHYSLFS